MSDLMYNQIAENSIDIVSDMPSVGIHVPDINVGDMISRQAAIDAIKELCKYYTPTKSVTHPHMDFVIEELQKLPSVPRKGKWIDYSDEGYVECPFCHSATNCDGNKDELHYCFSCGACMRGEQDD